MPLDHYVSQVYLRNFNSSECDGLLHAIRKSDLKIFLTKSSDICRIEDNSTNAYLKEDRAIEEFLKSVEPRYNASLTKIHEDKIDEECIHVVAGFIAYVLTCSPAGIRINSGPLRDMVNATARILDSQGRIPTSPPSLGEKSVTQLLAAGDVKFEIDGKYPQAIGIDNIRRHTSNFGNSHWEILHNDVSDSPFFTSDFPVAIEAKNANPVINRVVPLSPDLAIRIRPDIRLSGTAPDLTFANFSSSRRKLKRAEAAAINRLIVRCAEDIVLYRDERDWISNFVAKNQHFHIEPVSRTYRQNGRELLNPTQRILARNDEKSRAPSNEAA